MGGKLVLDQSTRSSQTQSLSRKTITTPILWAREY